MPGHIYGMIETIHHIPCPVVPEEIPVMLYAVHGVHYQTYMVYVRRKVPVGQRLRIRKIQEILAGDGRSGRQCKERSMPRVTILV